MSFTWKADKRLYTPEYAMQMMIRVAKELAIPDIRGACVCAGMCVYTESDYWMPGSLNDPCYAANPSAYPHDSEGNDHRSTGWYQQQMNAPGERPWGWGGVYGDPEGTRKRMDPYESTKLFLTDLKKKGFDASNAQSANDAVQRVQNSGLPQAYKKQWDKANDLFNRVNGGEVVPVPDTSSTVLTPSPGFKGDPFWLADVLRAEGLKVIEMDGWKERGQGDQGVLWGAVFHHTGNVNETPEGIAFHPSLGLAAHLLIRPNGDVYVCGIGKANHAGFGSWNGIQTDNANAVTIGVEVAILPVENAPHRSGWPDVQYFATVKTMAAILKKLAHPADHVISHKEWAQLGPAGIRQGKWDPGAIDMNIFRSDVAAQMNSQPPAGGNTDMATITIPASEWNAVRDALIKPEPSTSLYANKGETYKGTAKDYIRNIDAASHQELVERLAVVYGDDDAIRRVWNLAEGDGISNDAWAVEHGKLVLTRIDPDTLAAWLKKNGKN